MRRLIAAGLDADHANERGDTPLTIACSKGDLGLARLLVAKGAKPGARGRRADTPLLRAARFRRLEVARYLLDDLHVSADAPNRFGDTALIEAARTGNAPMIDVLLGAGASVAHANARGMTAFLEAADSGRLSAMKALHARGADAAAVDRYGDGAIELVSHATDAETMIAWLRSVGVVERRPLHVHGAHYEHHAGEHIEHDDHDSHEHHE